MKICPQCNKTYNDDNLNFCLDDGAVLNQAGAAQKGQNDLPDTVLISQPPQTAQNEPFGTGEQDKNFGAQQTNWGASQQTVQSPKKSSKSWLWVLGILGVLAVVCGGGLIGLVAWVSTFEDNTNWNSDNGSNASANSSNSSSVSKSATPDDRKNVRNIDLSLWAKGPSQYGNTEYQSGDFLMQANQEGFYYVLVAPSIYKTEDATTGVTIENRDNASTEMGYGLVFHSNPTPLKKGYAFLIDSDKKRYRIVRHIPGNELAVQNWTNSDAIKEGSQPNVVEIRDENGEIDFYINGEKVATKTNTFGYKGGVAGLYAGTSSPIIFSNFEIRQ